MSLEEVYSDITNNQNYPLLFRYLDITHNTDMKLDSTIYSKLHNGNLLIEVFNKPYSKIVILPKN